MKNKSCRVDCKHEHLCIGVNCSCEGCDCNEPLEENDAKCETDEEKENIVFMTVKSSQRKKSCCGDSTQYQLSGWDKDDWMCEGCFLNELINNSYQIKPQKF